MSTTLIYNEETVRERYGIAPTQLIDYKALVGDQSDNIPGVSGVGPKTAAVILQQYGSLENFFAQGQKDRSYQKIIVQKEKALLSKDLATIRTDAPIHPSLAQISCHPDWEKIFLFLAQKGFSSLAKRIPHSLPPSPHEEHQNSRPQKPPADSQGQLVFALHNKQQTPASPPEPTAIIYDAKEAIKNNTATKSFFDLMIAAQLLGISTSSWEDLAATLFKKTMPYEEFAPRAKTLLAQKIEQAGLASVFFSIETPLVPIIAEMEKNGVLVDKAALAKTTGDIATAIEEQRKKVKRLMPGGNDINLNSPKQLLDYFRRTMGINIKSTSATAMEKAAGKNPSPLFQELSSYRELFKLKTTYCDAFSRLIETDGRIHPTFLQLGAATGRMSCQNPNFQNIPQESAWAPLIRNIFVAPKNAVLMAFDYSQIELRILAHLSHDPHMAEAFLAGQDIHTITASRVFGTPPDQVTKEMRRIAKTLNFGMIYGMGSRAFAQTAGVSTAQAKEFIAKYFSEFSSIKSWQSSTLDEARTLGYARTETGRLRPLPALHSHNQWLASEAERMAINMPTQGLAADILKIAMVKTDRIIKASHLEAKIRLILSVHDELIFEVSQSIIDGRDPILPSITHTMESAYPLLVPLKINTKTGSRWGDLQ